MKKGIALSSILYTILVLFLALLYGIMALILSSRSTLETLKKNVFKELNPNPIYNSEEGLTYLTKEVFEDENNTWEDIIPLIKEGLYDDTSSSDLIGAERIIKVAAHTNDCLTVADKTNYETYVCTPGNITEKNQPVRIANVTPCSSSIRSNTACGFVIEFVNIIDTHVFSLPSASDSRGSMTGYCSSVAGHVYLDTTIFDSLPEIIQDNMLEVKVTCAQSGVSDVYKKIYLASPEEYTGLQISTKDKSYGTSRQLDYYNMIGVNSTTSTLIKKTELNNSTSQNYWTRIYPSNYQSRLYSISSTGAVEYVDSKNLYGLSPMFRLN